MGFISNLGASLLMVSGKKLSIRSKIWTIFLKFRVKEALYNF